MSARERSARVKAVLATLPEDQSEVVVLSYVDGLSHSEIAEKLNLPLGTVKSRASRALWALRSALGLTGAGPAPVVAEKGVTRTPAACSVAWVQGVSATSVSSRSKGAKE